MRPVREIDTRIAREIFGHEVWATNKTLHEKSAHGKMPLRNYSKEMDHAWPVATKMQITLVPVEGGRWFAFSGPSDGWESPQAFADFLAKGDFGGCGAALEANPALAICEAALRALDKRQAEHAQPALEVVGDEATVH